MDLKRKAARAAIELIDDDIDILGIGTGSTVNALVAELKIIRHKINGCVASSIASAKLLQQEGFTVFDLNVIDNLPLYIDGADEVNVDKQMIKGGGGALTREKILASAAKKFICIVDESKLVAKLGRFPLAIEVLPIARSFVARQIVKLGGDPTYRQGFLTDNGNIILDVYNLNLQELQVIEDKLNCIPGVVENGVFANRKADTVVIAKQEEVVVFNSSYAT